MQEPPLLCPYHRKNVKSGFCELARPIPKKDESKIYFNDQKFLAAFGRLKLENEFVG